MKWPRDIVSARLKNAVNTRMVKGSLVSSSVTSLKQHQASDNHTELHDRALKTEDALCKQKADIVRAVQAMSMNPAEPIGTHTGAQEILD